MQISCMFGRPIVYNIRTDNQLKQRTKMAVFVNLHSMNRNEWLEAAFSCEQLFKSSLVYYRRRTKNIAFNQRLYENIKKLTSHMIKLR